MAKTGLHLLLRPAAPRPAHDWLSATMAASCIGLADAFEEELGARIAVRFETLTQTIFSTLLPQVADRSVGAALRVGDARERAYLFVDRDAVFDLVEIAFGGDGSEPPYREERDFTSLEMQVGRYLIETFIGALAQISENGPPTIVVDRLEQRTESLAVPAYERGSIARFVLTIFQRETSFYIIIPDQLGPLLQKAYAYLGKDPEEQEGDREWSRRLQDNVEAADIVLRVVLRENGFTLGDVASFAPGQILALSASPRTPVTLEGDQSPLFSCQLGQAEGRYTVRVQEEIIGN